MFRWFKEGGEVMSEINRHRLYDSCMSPSREGAWVRYEDHAKLIAELEKEHTADVKLVRFISFNLGKRWQAGAVGVGGDNPGISGGSGTIEANVTKGYLLDGTEVSVENLGAEGGVTIHPQPKFKIGNQVTRRDSEKVRKIKNYYFSSEDNEWKYDIGLYYFESELTLYIPPTPAELSSNPCELIPTLKEHDWVRGTYKTGIAFGPCSVYYNEIGAMFAGDNHLIHWDTGKISDELATLERCEAPEVK